MAQGRNPGLNTRYAFDVERALNALGRTIGSVYYVDSTGSQSGAAASDSNPGDSWGRPLATIDAAINKCTANKGDVVMVSQFHNEGGAAADLFDADVAGISIVGMQIGAQRPIIDFDGTATTVAVGANNVMIKGIDFRPSVAAVVLGLDIETTVTGTRIEDCNFLHGEVGDGTDEFIVAIHLTGTNTSTVIKDVSISCHASAGAATHGIHVDAASDRCVYDNVFIDGPYATNGILEDAASVDTIVRNCRIEVTGANYGFVSTSTFGEFYNNRGSEDRVVNKLGQEYYPDLGYKVEKTEDGNVATSDDLFTLTGKVNIKMWTAEVTNALGASAKFSDYQITLTTLAGVLVAAGDISSSIIGHMFTLNADAGDTSLSTSTSAVSVAGVGDTNGKTGHLVVGKAGGADVIKAIRTAGDSGDAIIHSVFYQPLESGASLVTA